jgi:hypothetical protein
MAEFVAITAPSMATQSVSAIPTLFAGAPTRQFSLSAVNRQQIASIHGGVSAGHLRREDDVGAALVVERLKAIPVERHHL